MDIDVFLYWKSLTLHQCKQSTGKRTIDIRSHVDAYEERINHKNCSKTKVQNNVEKFIVTSSSLIPSLSQNFSHLSNTHRLYTKTAKQILGTKYEDHSKLHFRFCMHQDIMLCINKADLRIRLLHHLEASSIGSVHV